ncbi:MAG: RdgB/HAM1 family non-canonical purine NTP pyrophosphatase [Anaerolineales bacterium]|nr:MAG: RdgB/HAM1 family non-canonical purine NTP pyrophosphatase [Anaerolineales bacterium]
MKLILASQNLGKQGEMRALLVGLPLELLVPGDFDHALEIQETGGDYAENATLKASAFAKTLGHWTLGDDSGLEVEALEGAPGLHSARLIGPGRSDADRRQHLLTLLTAHPRPWRARFVCVVALASPGGEIETSRGECRGEIIPEQRGEWGFGYDPIFLVEGGELTMAELPMEQKNRVSHRARAFRAMLPILRKRIGFGTGSV